MAQLRFTSASSVLPTGANQHAFNTDTAGPDSLIVEANAALQAEGAGADAVRLGVNPNDLVGAARALVSGGPAYRMARVKVYKA